MQAFLNVRTSIQSYWVFLHVGIISAVMPRGSWIPDLNCSLQCGTAVGVFNRRWRPNIKVLLFYIYIYIYIHLFIFIHSDNLTECKLCVCLKGNPTPQPTTTCYFTQYLMEVCRPWSGCLHSMSDCQIVADFNFQKNNIPHFRTFGRDKHPRYIFGQGH